MSARAPIVGIFVGGKGRRMGGVAKGHLLYQGRSLLDGLLSTCQQQGVLPADLYLVGNSDAYEQWVGTRLSDNPPGVGPLGGLRALLSEASRLDRDAVALAVDLPYLRGELVARLLGAASRGALAPRQEGRWQPLFCRYHGGRALRAVESCLQQRRYALQSVFDALGAGAQVLPLTIEEQAALRDWDSPADVLSDH